MDPTGAALIFGGFFALGLGLVRDLVPPRWGSRWPGLEPRWHNLVPALVLLARRRAHPGRHRVVSGTRRRIPS